MDTNKTTDDLIELIGELGTPGLAELWARGSHHTPGDLQKPINEITDQM